MRKLLILVLLAAFGLPAVAPAFAMGEDASALLPACCRKSGAHHCMQGMANLDGKPAVSARCPMMPQPHAVAPADTFAALVSHSATSFDAPLSLTITQRADTLRRIARERSRHKRGPPALLFS